MMPQLKSFKFPEPGGWSKVAGKGLFPQGNFNPTAGFGAGDYAPGHLGTEIELDSSMVAEFRKQLLSSLRGASGVEGATLLNVYAGARLQYVRGLSTSTQVPAAGQLAYVSDPDNYVVTPDVNASNGNVAGVYLWTPENKGDTCLIVTEGYADVKCKTVVTNASTIGQTLYAESSASVGKVDGQAAATAVTAAILASELGTVIATLASNTIVKGYIRKAVRMI